MEPFGFPDFQQEYLERQKWFPMITVNGLAKGALYIEDAQLEEASSFTPYHFTGGGATQSHVSILGDGSVEVDAHGNIYPAVNGVGDWEQVPTNSPN